MTIRKFDPAQRKKLNSERRRASLPPELVLNDLEVKSGTIWADIGCGTGYFTLPLAGRVQQVYAVDIRTEMLEELTEALQQRNIHNVEVAQSRESVFPLSDNLLDGALTSLVVHEVDEPQVFFGELYRVLKTTGRLVVIEWSSASTEWGPPLDHRVAVEKLDQLALGAGLTKGRSWQWSNTFIGIEYFKKA